MINRIAILASLYATNMAFFVIFMQVSNPYVSCFASFFITIGLLIDPKNYHKYDALKRPIIYRITP